MIHKTVWGGGGHDNDSYYITGLHNFLYLQIMFKVSGGNKTSLLEHGPHNAFQLVNTYSKRNMDDRRKMTNKP